MKMRLQCTIMGCPNTFVADHEDDKAFACPPCLENMDPEDRRICEEFSQGLTREYRKMIDAEEAERWKLFRKQ